MVRSRIHTNILYRFRVHNCFRCFFHLFYATWGFIEARHKHAAVESAINAFENHRLDRCLDFDLKGFKRYVALAVLARNIQIFGAKLRQRRRARLAA
jgi:hypothetical protein